MPDGAIFDGVVVLLKGLWPFYIVMIGAVLYYALKERSRPENKAKRDGIQRKINRMMVGSSSQTRRSRKPSRKNKKRKRR